MTTTAQKFVRPDNKGRITLGRLAEGVSRFSIVEDKKNHRIILEPLIEIPMHEKWLFDNHAALNKVEKGLKDSAAKRLVDKGSFSKHIDEDE